MGVTTARRWHWSTRRVLTADEVLRWADIHHASTGKWPGVDSGLVAAAPGETWQRVENALRAGCRGLPGRSSLAKLLAEHRGARSRAAPPPLTHAEILAWAEAHYRRHGRGPDWTATQPIPEAPGETWCGISMALRIGRRGLPGGESPPRVLAGFPRAPRDASGGRRPTALSVEQVLGWCETHRVRTGAWPTPASGLVAEAPGHSWRGINLALKHGRYGLPKNLSLAQLVPAAKARVRRRVPPQPITQPSHDLNIR